MSGGQGRTDGHQPELMTVRLLSHYLVRGAFQPRKVLVPFPDIGEEMSQIPFVRLRNFVSRPSVRSLSSHCARPFAVLLISATAG